MYLLESELEDLVYENMQDYDGSVELVDRGLMVKKPLLSFRQLKIGNYGRADIVTLERSGIGKSLITVYELKKDSVNEKTLIQGARYLKGIIRWITKSDRLDIDNYQFRLVLLGKSVDTSDWIYLFELFKTSDIQICAFSYSVWIHGFSFEKANLKGYGLGKEGFGGDDISGADDLPF